MEKKYLRPKEVEAIYRIPAKTFANWRSQSRGPAYHKFGGKIGYAIKDMENWIASNRVPTIDYRQ